MPDDLVFGEVDLQQVPKRLAVALLRGRLVSHHGVHAAGRAPGRRGAGNLSGEEGERVFEDGRGDAASHGRKEVLHLLGAQRRGLDGQQDVEIVVDRVARVDALHVVLLLQLVDDRPVGAARHRLHVELAVELRVGIEDTDLPALLLGDRGDRTHQLVLDRNPPVDERQDHLLQPARERDPQEQVLLREAAADLRGDLARRDVVKLLGADRLFGEPLRVVDAHLDLLAAPLVQLAKHAEHVGPGLHVSLGHGGADERFDLDGPLGFEILEQLDRVGREGAEPFAGHVGADVVVVEEHDHGDREPRRRNRPDGVMARHEHAPDASAHPVAAPDQHHAHVEGHGDDGQEVGDPGEADDAAAEIAELLADAPLLDGLGHVAAGDHVGRRGEDQGHVEHGPEHVGHGQVRGQKGGHRADGQHGQADQPVSDVGSRQQARVGIAQEGQNRVVADQREGEGHGVNGHAGQIFSDHDVEVACGNRQQQLIGSLPALVGPDGHGHRGDEDQHDEGKDLVELVEVGQVGDEEVVGPERGNRAQQHEHADEDVARRIGKIADEIALEDRT